MEQLLLRHANVFSKNDMDVGGTTAVKHSIPLISGATPIKQRGYRYGPAQESEIQRQVQELLAQDLIEERKGAWSAPVVLVKKYGKRKFCVDYRSSTKSPRRTSTPSLESMRRWTRLAEASSSVHWTSPQATGKFS